MQPGMPSIRDCKSAVIPKPHRNMLEECFPVHNTSIAPLKLSYYTATQTRKPSPGEKTHLNLMKSNKQVHFVEEKNGVKGLHFLF